MELEERNNLYVIERFYALFQAARGPKGSRTTFCAE